MTGVSFNNIPGDWKVPLVSIEVDNSQANTATGNKPALLVDYAFDGAKFNEPIAVGSPSQAASLFGLGSPLERAYSTFYANNKSQIVYCMAIQQPAEGSVAKGSINVSGTATDAGIYSLLIAGQEVNVGVNFDDAAATVAQNIADKINSIGSLPVTANASAEAVTLAAKWKGQTGNDISIFENTTNRSTEFDERPTGLTLTFDNFLSGGTGVPDWTAAIAALGDENYKFVSLPHTDTGTIKSWATEFGFDDTGRWGWIRMLYGQIWSAKRGNYADLISFGKTLNYPTLSFLAIEKNSPTPVWEWAAAYTARAAAAFTIDPARPLQTLTLLNILPAKKEERFSKTERNGLASNGLATQTVFNNETPQIDREQTSYQFNSYGRPDNSYEVATTLSTLDEVLTRLGNSITSKYPRHKLADDGTFYASGQAIITPTTAKAELVTEYSRMVYDGLVENLRDFKNNLIVQRSDTNPNRLEILYDPYLIGGLRSFSVLAQFRLAAATDFQGIY